MTLLRLFLLLSAVLSLHMPMPVWSEGEKVSERRPAIISRTDDKQMRSFYAARLIIDSVTRECVRAWLSEEEFAWARSRGWEVQWLPQPIYEATKETTGKIEKQLDFPLASYPSYAQLADALQIFAASYPEICRLVSIGKSVQGRDLWFLKISDNPDLEEDEPEFKYISTMHGSEPVGMVMCLDLIDLLLSEYGSDQRLTRLVNETEIWIMPLMNPDGYTINSRFNANGADLNRSFPDRVDDPNNTPLGRPPEVQVMMAFGAAHSSALSANFHTGALLVNYPYDNSFDNESENPDWHTPDDDLFVNVSLAYSSHNPPMFSSLQFDQGITNGITWYVVSGGMQDWNYTWLGCNEVTIELSNTFRPSASTLPTLWNNNRESMLSYMEKAQIGVRGRVTDSVSGAPVFATVRIAGRDHNVFTDPDVGDYHRLILPGTYELEFTAQGYDQQTVAGVVVADGTATRIDVALVPNGLGTATPTSTASPTRTVTHTLSRTPSVTATPTVSPTPLEGITPTPTTDYDVVQDGVINAKDLIDILSLQFYPPETLFDFARFWGETQ